MENFYTKGVIYSDLEPYSASIRKILVIEILITPNSIQAKKIFKRKFVLQIDKFISLLKNKIEDNSTWGGAFYKNLWVKINSHWVILVFSLSVCCC